MSDGPRRAPRADSQRSRGAILDAAAVLFARDGAAASLEQIARQAGVGSATLHRHFRGRQALLEAVFLDRVEQLCAAAQRIAHEQPADAALWTWLREIARHCVQEKALATLVRAGAAAQESPERRSFALLGQAGRPLRERAVAAGALRPDVTIGELLLVVNAVADVCSAAGADVDRLLDLTWEGLRRPPGAAPQTS